MAVEGARVGSGVTIHPTAIVEPGVTLGSHTSVWDSAHIRRGAVIGRHCIIGEKTYIAYDVRIGDFVKLNAFVYVCAGVTIEQMVMISAGTVFTNDKFPRAADPDRQVLLTSAPTDDTLTTVVRIGTTIGANATIGPGLELGRFCMVGMGAVVTKNVKPFQLVLGCPARPAGWVCVCGKPLAKRLPARSVTCAACRRRYRPSAGGLEWMQASKRKQRVASRSVEECAT